MIQAHREDTVILPFPPRFEPVSRARSTIIRGSLASLAEAGYLERYLPLLTGPHRDEVLGALAGTWLPLEAALTHYRACEGLGLSSEDAAAVGRAVFARTGATLFGTVLRVGRSAGITPWSVLGQLQRFWDRGYEGGGIRVVRLGPKEARIDMAKCAFANNSFYRHALSGLVGEVLGTFSQRVFVKEPPGLRGADAMSLCAQWV